MRKISRARAEAIGRAYRQVHRAHFTTLIENYVYHDDVNLSNANATRRILDCGFTASGRRFLAIYDGQELHIMCGCQWLTLAQARKYWRGKPDRAATRAAIRYAIEIAKSRGWNVD